MKKVFLFLLSFVPSGLLFSQLDAPLKPIDENRVKEIISLLSDEPRGFGEPYTDRKHWDALLQSGKYDDFLGSMKKFSFPEFSEEDYFSLSKGASSSAKGLEMMRRRAAGLAKFVWAECLENKGSYTSVISQGLESIIRQKSWVSPRNDYQFRNYKGEEYSVELTSALYAHTIAQTLYLLGDKISTELREKAISALYERVFTPVLNTINTVDEKSMNQFLTKTNNYNPVCLSGLVGAAVTTLKDKRERAVFIHIGEYYSLNGLMGFNDDGYCTEGVVYFNYGFGNYILLRESIWQATQGKLDLFRHPKVKNIVWYPAKLEIINNVFPAISDTKEGTKPNKTIMSYLNRESGVGCHDCEEFSLEGQVGNLLMDVMMVFPNSTDLKPDSAAKVKGKEELRSFFDKSVVLVCRPKSGSESNIGVSIKGGNNQEHHNHNDVGSYTFVCGATILVGDPGSIPYTADIFNANARYTYKTLGSYGHPVPLVAGKEQKVGKEASARILKIDFTDQKDELTIDITSAYDVADLLSLERAFIYSREGRGSFSVSDTFTFSKKNTFETAIITRGKWEITDDNCILIERAGKKTKIQITSNRKLKFKTEEISEGGTRYTRIGIAVREPAQEGWIAALFNSI